MGERNCNYGKTGELCPNYGRKHTEEELIKQSIALKGKYMGKDNKNSKTYIITFPDDHEEIIIGLNKFCKENNLDSDTITKVAKIGTGRYKQHKGFKCRYYIEPFYELTIIV
jgi:hypothetical protein